MKINSCRLFWTLCQPLKQTNRQLIQDIAHFQYLKGLNFLILPFFIFLKALTAEQLTKSKRIQYFGNPLIFLNIILYGICAMQWLSTLCHNPCTNFPLVSHPRRAVLYPKPRHWYATVSVQPQTPLNHPQLHLVHPTINS